MLVISPRLGPLYCDTGSAGMGGCSCEGCQDGSLPDAKASASFLVLKARNLAPSFCLTQ